MDRAESLVRSALDRLNEHDVEGYLARCTEDFCTTNEFGVARGKAEVRALFEALETIPDHWRTIERVEVSGTTVSVWLQFGGTVAATGRSFVIEACNTVWEVRGDLLCSATEHGDYQPWIEAARPAP